MISSIPKYREIEIIKLYEASKHTLGTDTRQRRRIILSTFRIYYPWENRETIEYMFNTFIKPLDIEYMTILRSKNIKKSYGRLVKELFSSMDANDDGCIDLDEFKYSLRKVDDIIPEDLFNKADTNDDGVLDTNEFYRLVASTPELRNNFDIIIRSAIHENQKRVIECQSRIFKNDVTGRRPSLSDLRSTDNICAIDVPLYGVSLPPCASVPTRLRYGL